jgi:hypothetical protein
VKHIVSAIHRQHLSEALRGKPKSPEHRAKLSIALSGHVPWNKGKSQPHVRYRDTDPQRCARISRALEGKPRPYMVERNKRLRSGIAIPLEQRKKISSSMRRARRTTNPIWNKGLTKSDHAGIASAAAKNSALSKGRSRPFVSAKQGIRRFWYYGPDCSLKMRSRWEVAYAHWLDSQKVRWLYEPITFIGLFVSYTPDFYLPDSDLFHEVKGRTSHADRYKIYALRERYGCKIFILCGKTLQRIGLLDAHQRVVPGIGGAP